MHCLLPHAFPIDEQHSVMVTSACKLDSHAPFFICNQHNPLRLSTHTRCDASNIMPSAQTHLKLPIVFLHSPFLHIFLDSLHSSTSSQRVFATFVL